MSEWINLREERDFGEKFNATFQFASQNFKSLSICLLFLGAPLMIVANLFVAHFQAKLGVGNMNNAQGVRELVWYMYLVILPVYLVAYTWLMTLTYAYISEYLAGNREITPAQVFGRAIKKLPKILLANLVSTILIIIAFLLLIVPGIYFMIAITFIQAIIIIEEQPVFKSFSRSITLISGKWWSTFGLVVVMGIISGLMQLIFTIPTYVNAAIKVLHKSAEMLAFDWGTILTNMVSTVGITLLYPLIFIAIAFQYFNLVERRESQGLKQQIIMASQQIESTPKNEGDY